MKKFLMAAAGLMALVGVSSPSQAVNLSWNISSVGSITVAPGPNIDALSATLSFPASTFVAAIAPADAASAALAGIVLLGTVTISPLAIPLVPVGPLGTDVVITAGLLTYTFTDIFSSSIVPTPLPGGGAAGTIDLVLLGTITGDTSLGNTFLNQSASFSMSCTQTDTGSSIGCGTSIDTPASTREIPEPATLALLGAGLLGLGLARRRRA